MTEELVNDVAREIANDILSRYSRNNWITQEEIEDLFQIAESSAKAKIKEGFSPLCKIAP